MVEMNKHLMTTKKLKTKLLREHHGPVHVFYDDSFDALLIQIVPPDKETIVHYIDDKNVALLYESKSKEVVGLQIEGFKNSFLPMHDSVAKVWRKAIQVQDYGELVLEIEKREPEIAKEVMEASRSVIEQKDLELAALLNKSFTNPENNIAA